MTNAVLAVGTQLQKQDPVALTWATVSEVRSITGPEFKTDIKDVTNHSSPGRTRERVGVLNDPGNLKFEVNYIPNDPTQNESTGLLGDQQNFRRPQFRVIAPDVGNKTVTFQGVVNMFSETFKVDDVMLASCEITIVSAPTFSGT